MRVDRSNNARIRPQRMRDGLRRLAKAVVVTRCEHVGVRFAMAATTVSEREIEPPSRLTCVNRTASLCKPVSAGANFMCRNDRQVDYGTHGVFIGGVVDVLSHGTVDPLFYVNGCYTVASPAEPSAAV